MRIFALLICAVCCLNFTSCEEAQDLLTFELKETANFTVPRLIHAVDTNFTITTPNIPTNLKKTAEANGTNLDLVKDINLSSIKLTSTDPSTQDLGFLKTLNLYILTDNLPEKLIATKSNIPTGVGNELSLDATGAILDDYLKSDEFKLKIDIGADETLDQATEIASELVMSITADPLSR